jgi:hypothetical protein
LWKIGYAILLCCLVAVAGLALLTWLALVILHHPRIAPGRVLSVHDAVGVLQLVFASVAGAGALVALVVAYRRQRVSETASGHDRTRVFNERFTAIAAQLGDSSPAVRLAGVHAMAGLADDWVENRQTCIDVLCAYLRLPYSPYPGDDASANIRLEFKANREVRHTVVRVIASHLLLGVETSWSGLNFDFTDVIFDGGSFAASVFNGNVDFSGAVFIESVSFSRVRFGAITWFMGAKFSGRVSFFACKFGGRRVDFSDAQFAGGTVDFTAATFDAISVSFGSVFSAGKVIFQNASVYRNAIDFHGARFCGSEVFFYDTKLYGDTEIDFGTCAEWSVPPKFSRDGSMPVGVLLPPSPQD